MLLKKHEIFSEAATHLLKHKKYVQKQLHNFFTVAAHTLREDFHNLSMMVIKTKVIYVPWPMLSFHWPVQASYYRLCSGLSCAY